MGNNAAKVMCFSRLRKKSVQVVHSFFRGGCDGLYLCALCGKSEVANFASMLTDFARVCVLCARHVVLKCGFVRLMYEVLSIKYYMQDMCKRESRLFL